jgi:hypothetical protein
MQMKKGARATAIGAFGLLAVVSAVAAFPRLMQSQGQEAKPAVRQHEHNLDSSYTFMPLPPSESAYASFRGDHMKDYINQIVAFSLKDRDEGNLLWGRVAGTKNDVLVEDWVADKFKQIGLQDVHKQTFNLPPQWFPTSWGLTATGSGQTLTFKTLRASGTALPPGGVDLEPVWVGLGTEADFAGRDVKGKLAVIYSWPTPGIHDHSAEWLGALKRAASKGAAAVVLNIAIPGNVTLQESPSPSSAKGLPTFTMGSDDGAALRTLMEKGPVKVHAEYTLEMRPGLTDSSVWGTLPGKTDEDIIVMAHHDAVFEGAEDNASGMAVMLALAEYYAKIPQDQRRRTIKFVTTAGHHNGSFGTAWMHENRSTFLAKTALMLNAEHVSSTQLYVFGLGPVPPVLRESDNIDARRWFVNGSDKLASIALNAWKEFGVTMYDKMDATPPGDMAHVGADAPSVGFIESSYWYHTDMDTPEHVPNPGLEAAARSSAKIIDEVNKLDLRDLLPGGPSDRGL